MTHGIYDSQQNRGYITLGNSKYTSELACDYLKIWWNNHGKATYPNANSILLNVIVGVVIMLEMLNPDTKLYMSRYSKLFSI